MSIADLMEKEISRQTNDPTKVAFVKKTINTNIHYVNHVNSRKENPTHNKSKIIQYVAQNKLSNHDSQSIPSRFELNAMRKRINIHRRWIQLGIIIGAIGLGSKIPQLIDWYSEAEVVPKYTPTELSYTPPKYSRVKHISSTPSCASKDSKNFPSSIQYQNNIYLQSSTDPQERQMYNRLLNEVIQ